MIIQSAITSEIKRMEIGLAKTNRRIEQFEKIYHVSSDQFLRDYGAEDMKKGDEEYIQWDGELKIRERLLEDLRNLTEIEYAAS